MASVTAPLGSGSSRPWIVVHSFDEQLSYSDGVIRASREMMQEVKRLIYDDRVIIYYKKHNLALKVKRRPSGNLRPESV